MHGWIENYHTRKTISTPQTISFNGYFFLLASQNNFFTAKETLAVPDSGTSLV